MHAAISFLECASCAMCPTKEPSRAGEHQESKVYYLEVLINYEVDAYNVCGVEGLSPFGFTGFLIILSFKRHKLLKSVSV